MFTLLRWWFIFCLSALGLGIATFLGAPAYLLKADVSHLSFVILGIFALGSIWIGQLTYRARHMSQTFRRHLPLCWYLAEVQMGLGMIGTLVGFLVLLGQALGQPINTADTAAMTQLIAKMGIGFSTAAVTTLVGLSASLIFKLQLINLEYQLREPFEEE